jgi:hypothetical protein
VKARVSARWQHSHHAAVLVDVGQHPSATAEKKAVFGSFGNEVDSIGPSAVNECLKPRYDAYVMATQDKQHKARIPTAH